MVIDEGMPRYLGEREAEVTAWFGEDMNETTLISLTPATPGDVWRAARPARSAKPDAPVCSTLNGTIQAPLLDR